MRAQLAMYCSLFLSQVDLCDAQNSLVAVTIVTSGRYRAFDARHQRTSARHLIAEARAHWHVAEEFAGLSDMGMPDQNLEALREAIQHCRNLWIVFLSYCVTTAILASGVTNADLLLETPLRLPLFDVGVPLILFFFATPLLLVLLHVDLLMRLHDLRVRTRALESKVDMRLLIPVLDYLFLAANLVSDRRERVILRAISTVTIFAVPIVALLFLERQFLPFHSSALSWWHRVLIVADLMAILLVHYELRISFYRALELGPVWMMHLAVMFLAIFIISFPGEGQDFVWPRQVAGTDIAEFFGLPRSLDLRSRHLSAKEPPPQIVAAYLARQAQPSDDEADDALNAEDARSVAERLYGEPVDLRNRNLTFANFAGSTLIGADFTRANLSNSNFDDSQLTDAQFDHARLDRATFEYANLRVSHFADVGAVQANFNQSDLTGSEISSSQFTGATFRGASLTLAHVSRSNLDAVDMIGVTLDGAQISDSSFVGDVFLDAEIGSASIHSSDIRGTVILGMQPNHLDESWAPYAFIMVLPTTSVQAENAKNQQDTIKRAKLLSAFRGAHIIKNPDRPYNFNPEIVGAIDCCGIEPEFVPPAPYVKLHVTDLDTGKQVQSGLDVDLKTVNPTDYKNRIVQFLTTVACNGHAVAQKLSITQQYPIYPTLPASSMVLAESLALNRVLPLAASSSDEPESASMALAFLSNQCVRHQLSVRTILRLQQLLSQHAAHDLRDHSPTHHADVPR